MPRPRHRLWPRAAAVALLGLIGLLADARPARAMGCHAPDRPVLGLGLAIWADAGLALDIPAAALAPEARIVPRSCPGEQPGPVAADPAPQPPAAGPARVEPDPTPAGRLRSADVTPRPPLPRHEIPDRPPRTPVDPA